MENPMSTDIPLGRRMEICTRLGSTERKLRGIVSSFGRVYPIRSVFLFGVFERDVAMGQDFFMENPLARLHIAVAGVEFSWR
jgi:hypothetical protein